MVQLYFGQRFIVEGPDQRKKRKLNWKKANIAHMRLSPSQESRKAPYPVQYVTNQKFPHYTLSNTLLSLDLTEEVPEPLQKQGVTPDKIAKWNENQIRSFLEKLPGKELDALALAFSGLSNKAFIALGNTLLGVHRGGKHLSASELRQAFHDEFQLTKPHGMTSIEGLNGLRAGLDDKHLTLLNVKGIKVKAQDYQAHLESALRRLDRMPAAHDAMELAMERFRDVMLAPLLETLQMPPDVVQRIQAIRKKHMPF